jgi:hypothetical protein
LVYIPGKGTFLFCYYICLVLWYQYEHFVYNIKLVFIYALYWLKGT